MPETRVNPWYHMVPWASSRGKPMPGIAWAPVCLKTKKHISFLLKVKEKHMKDVKNGVLRNKRVISPISVKWLLQRGSEYHSRISWGLSLQIYRTEINLNKGSRVYESYSIWGEFIDNTVSHETGWKNRGFIVLNWLYSYRMLERNLRLIKTFI